MKNSISIILTLLLAGCSSRTMGQMVEGMVILFGGLIGFFILCWFCVTVHNSLGEEGKKTWEKICGIGFILIFIILAMLSDGGGDMENIWRARR